MPRSYSEDLRKRVLGAYRSGQLAKEISASYDVDVSCVYRWDKLERETGGLSPLYKAPNREIIRDDAKFLAFVEVHAHSTLKQMAAAWEDEISQMSLSRKLKKLGITRKKRLHAIESATR